MNMLKGCALFFCLSLHVLCCAFAEPNAEAHQSPQTSLLNGKDAVVRIFATSDKSMSSGTGFIISSQGLIATNNHVIRDQPDIIVYILAHDGSSAKAYRATVAITHPSADLTILQIKGDIDHLPTPLQLSAQPASVLDDVVAIGYPAVLDVHLPHSAVVNQKIITNAEFLDNLRPNMTKGAISKLSQWVIHDAKIASGNSGGPLISQKTGKVVGINTASKQAGSVFFMAIPVSTLIDLLDSYHAKQSLLAKLESEIKQHNPQSMYALAMEIFANGTMGKYTTTEAIKLLNQAAQLGHKPAHVKLGDLHQDGTHMKRDIHAGVRHYKKADTPEAWIRLSSIYAEGTEGIAADQKKAYRYAQRAAETGIERGIYQLALLTKDGIGVEKSLSSAIQILERKLSEKLAGQESSSFLRLKLAQFLFAQAEKSSLSQAIKLATEIANAPNDPNRGDACELLGQLYDSYPIDGNHKEKAIQYYKLGADLNHAECMIYLAEAYLKGKQVEKSPIAAINLLHESLRIKEAPRAHMLLGDAYDTIGENELAVKHYLKAAQLGYAPAQMQLAIVYGMLSEKLPDARQKARYWLEQVAAQSAQHPDLSKSARELLSKLDSAERSHHNASTPKSTPPPRTLDINDRLYALAVSPDNRYIAIGGKKNMVYLIDIATRRTLHQIRHPKPVYTVCFSNDGRYLASASYDGTIHVTDMRSHRVYKTFKQKTWIKCVKFSPDHRYLATAGTNAVAQVYQLSSGKIVYTLKHAKKIESIDFHPTQNLMISGSNDGSIKLSSPLRKTLLDSIHANQTVNSLALSPHGDFLLVGGNQGLVKVYACTLDQIDPRPIVEENYGNDIYSVAFSPSGEYFAISTVKGLIKIYNLGSEDVMQKTLQSGSGQINAIAFSADSEYLITVGNSGIIEWIPTRG